ncbi:hypothetical protein APS67_002768 [Streptomyces sp. AVP053U2]|nr:hypothetical protein APS67_002768 [Streptomyces sp. AVP053U2]
MPENESWEYSRCIPNDPRAVTVSRRTCGSSSRCTG